MFVHAEEKKIEERNFIFLANKLKFLVVFLGNENMKKFLQKVIRSIWLTLPFFSGCFNRSVASPPSDFGDSEEVSTSPANVCHQSKFRIKTYIIIHSLIQLQYNYITNTSLYKPIKGSISSISSDGYQNIGKPH